MSEVEETQCITVYLARTYSCCLLSEQPKLHGCFFYPNLVNRYMIIGLDNTAFC